MTTVLIYASSDFKNKNLIEENFKEIDKIYCFNFDLNSNLNNTPKNLNKYKYLIYLDDNTNYNFNNLLNDVNNGLNILNNNVEIQQVLFDNYICANIDAKILNEDKTHFSNEISILNEQRPKYHSGINYANYVNFNFDRLFIPSIIKTSLFVNCNEKITNIPHHEHLFLKTTNIERHIINTKNNLIFNQYNNIGNINEDLTIVTGYIKLNENKIQKYAKRTV